MKKGLLFAFLTAVLAAGCTEETEDAVRVTSSTVVEIYSVEKQSATVDFQTSASWTASCSAGWLSFSPAKGEAGNHSLTLVTTATNRTKSSRSAQLNIRSGSMQKTVTVIQSGDYAVFEQEEYRIGAEGGRFYMNFTTNLESSAKLQIGYTIQDWLSWASDGGTTRGENSGRTYDVIVQPNTSENARMAAFALQVQRGDQERIMLDTCYLYQEGINSGYESTDYSADGVVSVLQQSEKGRGIPIVLMGDGFTDISINNGTYARVMEKALDNLFSEEPARSMRAYFDVYMVTAVSKNGVVGSNYSTAFSCVPSHSSSSIEYDENKVMTYFNKVRDIDRETALGIVIVNSKGHNGVTAMYYNTDTRQPIQFSLSFCTIVDSLGSETFRQVLVHEAIGHGLAKLADEYSYEKNGAASNSVINTVAWYHLDNWLLNVDTSPNAASVIWSPFIGNSSFASENIGVYEGGYTYSSGIFRPTEESMMNSNQSPFNAPSRKAIYDKILYLGEGREPSTMESFAEFDALHKPSKWDYSTTRGLSVWSHRFLVPPIIKFTQKRQ